MNNNPTGINQYTKGGGGKAKARKPQAVSLFQMKSALKGASRGRKTVVYSSNKGQSSGR